MPKPSKSNPVLIPSWLREKSLSESGSDCVVKFGVHFDLQLFDQISFDLIEQYYGFCGKAEGLKLITVLGLYGLNYSGKFSRYSRGHEAPVLLKPTWDDFRSVEDLDLVLNVVEYLTGLGLTSVQSLRGIGLDIISAKIKISLPLLVENFVSVCIPVVDQDKHISSIYRRRSLRKLAALQRSQAAKVQGSQRARTGLELGLKLFRRSSVVHSTVEAWNQVEIVLSNPLKLSRHARGILARNQVGMLGQIVDLEVEELEKLRNCGRQTAVEIRLAVLNFLEANQESWVGLAQPRTEGTALRFESASIDYLVGLSDYFAENILRQSISILALQASSKSILEDNGIETLQDLFRSLQAFSRDLACQDIIEEIWHCLTACIVPPARRSATKLSLDHLTLKQLPLFGNPRPIEELFDFGFLVMPVLEDNSLFQTTRIFSVFTWNKLELINCSCLWQLFFYTPLELLELLGEAAYCEVVEYVNTLSTEKVKGISKSEFFVAQLLYFYQYSEHQSQLFMTNRQRAIYFARNRTSSAETLSSIAAKISKSRERVRQLENEAELKMRQHFDYYSKLTNRLAEQLWIENIGILIFKYASASDLDVEAINYFLGRILGLECLLERNNEFILVKKVRVDDVDLLEEISELLFSKDTDREILAVEDDVIASVRDCLNRRAASWNYLKPVSVTNVLAVAELFKSSHLVAEGGGTYRNKYASLFDLVAQKFAELCPVGSLLYQQEEELMKLFYHALPQLREREGFSYVQRVFIDHPDIFLWGRGYYIHRANVQSDLATVSQMVKECENEFLSGNKEFVVHLLFNRNREALLRALIPTPQALYSLIRAESHERIDTPRYPRVMEVSIEPYKRRHCQLIEDFLWSRGGKALRDEVYDYFVNKGWKIYLVTRGLRASKRIEKHDDWYVLI